MDRKDTNPYARMTKAELVAEIKALQLKDSTDELARTVVDLETHQVELEMQNRELQETRGQLEESRDRFVRLYDFAPIAYLTLDRLGMVREINLTGAELLGRERAKLIGLPFALFLSNSDHRVLWTHLKDCASGARVSAELTLCPRGGEEKAIHVFSQLESETEMIRSALVDISDRKKVEDERAHTRAEQALRTHAEEANRVKDDFLATLSHELRTPLNTIQGWLHVLRAGKLGKTEFGYALDVIQRSVQAQVQLINDLLDLSRIARGHLTLEVEPVDLRSVVQAAAESVRLSAEQKEIQLRVKQVDAACVVSGSFTRLQQIVWNLLANAIKFTPRGGSVEVTVERSRRPMQDGDRAIVVVRDSGIGIAPAFLPYVFDRFRQADSSTTRAYSGLGLGLAIVRHLAELHGGYVTAESDGEARGATFTVSLPIIAAAPRAETPAAEAPPEKPTHHPLRGLCLLVLDDDAFTSDMLEKLLEQEGAEVIKAGAVPEAILALENHAPDVLICDIGLPGEDGFSFIRRVRSLPPEAFRQPPAIAVTAFASRADEKQALEAGFDVFLTKPIEPDRLTIEIARLAGRGGSAPPPPPGGRGL